ncbi:hypothetical protein PENSPDRAFT_671446 [Peniophora sp. CONT]|nr:hypothetical protein PENSPDRAFT_671446 [Peniophora sp. CONT]
MCSRPSAPSTITSVTNTLSPMSGVNTNIGGWCAIDAAASEIGEEDEEYEIDELMDDDEVSAPNPSISGGKFDPCCVPTGSEKLCNTADTWEDALAAPANSTPSSTTTTDAASNDGQANPAAPTTREHQKRPRHDSTSDDEDDEDDRRVRQLRSRAPSPPSFPPSPHTNSARDFDDPCPLTPHERALASHRKARFAIVDRELLDRHTAILLQLRAAAGLSTRADVAGGPKLVNGSGASKERARSASYGSDSFIDDESDTLSTGRAPSDVDDDREHHVHRSAMIARSLGARYRMEPCAPTTEVYDNKPRGLKKPKFPPKPHAEATPSTVESSIPPSERALSNAPSAGTADHPIDVDAPTDEEQVNEWAALVRSFVKGKSTRVRDHSALLNALIAASDTRLSAQVLVQSGLYSAVRALGEQTLAGEMFAAVEAAKELAKRWEGQFGAALEEDV